jgi:N-acetylmuramic acid 6-phosphate etherase
MQLLLGVDGGGSKTTAAIALVGEPAEPQILGRGAGPASNPRRVGFDAAYDAIEQAVDSAFTSAGLSRRPVSAACLGIAGCGRPVEREQLRNWAWSNSLANRVAVVHDALPVLAAGCPQGVGIALIAGTGSLAYGRSSNGAIARAGGWGYAFGDEGSGYWIGIESLRAVTQAADGRGPATRLTDAFLATLGLSEPSQLVETLVQSMLDVARIASLAPLAIEAAAQGDDVARAIISQAANELASMVKSVARKLDLKSFDLALAGGLLSSTTPLASEVLKRLRGDSSIATFTHVPDPLLGALRIAEWSLKDDQWLTV